MSSAAEDGRKPEGSARYYKFLRGNSRHGEKGSLFIASKDTPRPENMGGKVEITHAILNLSGNPALGASIPKHRAT